MTAKLIRDMKFPVGGSPANPVEVTRTVGWREEAVSDVECRHCWGTGRELLYGRSLNCECGIHATCAGHQDPRCCGCYCHTAPPEVEREDAG